MATAPPPNPTYRKKKKNPPPRRHHVTADGWTHVLNGPPHTLPIRSNAPPTPPLYTPAPTNPPADLTLAAVEAAAQASAARWRASACSAEMARLLASAFTAADRPRLTTCVCLGLGSFTAPLNANHPRQHERALYQLAALEEWIEMLRRTNPHLTRIYLQDPAFNALDTAYLAALPRAFTVLPPPAALAHLGPHTFLFAPCAEWSVVGDALRAGAPGLYIGNELGGYQVFAGGRPPTFPGPDPAELATFLRSRHAAPMPAFALCDWTVAMAVYWRGDTADAAAADADADVEPDAELGVDAGPDERQGRVGRGGEASAGRARRPAPRTLPIEVVI